MCSYQIRFPFCLKAVKTTLLLLLCAECLPKDGGDDSCWSGRFANLRGECCDLRHGPTGHERCWGGAYNFDRCCGKGHHLSIDGARAYCFTYKLCCSFDAPCTSVVICCQLAARSQCNMIPPAPACCARGLHLPRLALDEVDGSPAGDSFGVRGTIMYNVPMEMAYQEQYHQKPPFRHRLLTAGCLDAYEMSARYRLIRVSRASKRDYADCWDDGAFCTLWASRIGIQNLYLWASYTMREDVEYLVKAPASCSAADVVMLLLPRLLQREFEWPVAITEVRLQAVDQADDCQDRDAPPFALPVLSSVVLASAWIAKLLARWWMSHKRKAPQREETHIPFKSLEARNVALDVVRVVALWFVYNEHTANPVPFRSLCSAWLGLSEGYLQALQMFRFECLYPVLTVRLLSRVPAQPNILAGCLLRKVLRQFLVAYFYLIWLPHGLYVSGPMNCMEPVVSDDWSRAPRYAYMPFGRTIQWMMRLLTMSMCHGSWVPPTSSRWPTVVWFFEVEMKLFAALATMKLLAAARPKLAAPCTLVLFAYVAMQVRLCDGSDYKNIANSIKFNWLPVTVLLFYADRYLVSIWERLQNSRCGTVFVLLLLPVSFYFSAWVWELPAWQYIGFPYCSGKELADVRWVLSGLPWNFAILAFSHSSVHLPAAVLDIIAFVSRISLPLQLGHRIIKMTVSAQFPAWSHAHWGQPKSLIEQHVFYVAPLLLLNVLIAYVVQILVAEPWMGFARSLERRSGAVYVFAIAYASLCSYVWWADATLW